MTEGGKRNLNTPLTLSLAPNKLTEKPEAQHGLLVQAAPDGLSARRASMGCPGLAFGLPEAQHGMRSLPAPGGRAPRSTVTSAKEASLLAKHEAKFVPLHPSGGRGVAARA